MTQSMRLKTMNQTEICYSSIVLVSILYRNNQIELNAIAISAMPLLSKKNRVMQSVLI
jgi:hypothetical protein